MHTWIVKLRSNYRRVLSYELRSKIRYAIRIILSPYYSLLRFSGQIHRIYTSDWFAGRQFIEVSNAPILVTTLMTQLKPQSVIDIGCATGGYLAEFSRYGVRIMGVDGARTVVDHLLIPRQNLIIHDLKHPLYINDNFDLCICIEVAEHLDARYADTLVKSITRSSDTIFFTAAPPGQGGEDHVNEQPPEYWIRLFMGEGFAYQKELTESLRWQLKDLPAGYIVENMMMFKKYK